MKTCWLRFNLYLCVGLAVCVGCQTAAHKRKYQPSTLRVHIEVHPGEATVSLPVPIYREHPVMVNVDKTPVLTEASVADAQVVNTVGGFAIRLQFDREGTWVLEQRSLDSRGQRFAIFSMFGPDLKESRWLAAPIIGRRITDGVLIFTPDATRAEADEVVLGLNNVARGVKKKTEW